MEGSADRSQGCHNAGGRWKLKALGGVTRRQAQVLSSEEGTDHLSLFNPEDSNSENSTLLETVIQGSHQWPIVARSKPLHSQLPE